MSLDLFADQLKQDANTRPVTPVAEPGAFEGFFRGTGMGIMKEGAKLGRAVSMGLSVAPIAVDAMTNSVSAQDRWFKSHDEFWRSAVDYWTPGPNEVGLAGEVTGTLLGMLPQIIANPLAAVAAQQLSQSEDLITKPGVSIGQAVGVGAVQGVGLGLGIKAPMWGSNIWNRMAIGGGFNVVQGAVTRGASAQILEGTEAAKEFPAFGTKELWLDALLGVAFGGVFHFVPSARLEGTEAYNNAKTAAKAWADTLKPSDKAALAVLREGQHLNVDSLPGTPNSPVATERHVQAMRDAIDSLIKDKPVDVEGQAPKQDSEVPRETVEAFSQRAGEEIGGVSHLKGIVESLQKTYIEQGPDAGRAVLDDMATRAPESSGFSEEVRTPGFIDALHGELTTRAEEYARAQDPPTFTPDPARQAAAEAQVAHLMADAPRIAAEEGLPMPPQVVEPVRAVVERDLLAAGRTPGEATEAANIWHAAMNSIGKAAGIDPDALFHRYMAGVRATTGEAPASALAQNSRNPFYERPADNIQAYKPKVETSQYGGRVFSNKHVELGNSRATDSKGIKGERRVFEIFDRTGGRTTNVGFTIVEIDSQGRFAALRNIEIREDIRSKGIGEKVIATMLAHNPPGFDMDIVDITHGGKKFTKDDALPFWQKIGTQLKNYSNDPNVQMDGMLSQERYLTARRGDGQGPAGGRGRGEAAALQADRGGAGAAGSGGRRGGPSAADRAELARLNGTLFQGANGTWYHSALERAIDETPTKAGTADTWKQWLKGQLNKGTIKADEIKYTGIEEYLDLQQGKITKEQLQTFMREGGVRVEEVELGGRLDGMDREVAAYEARTGREAQDANGDWAEDFETSPEGARFLRASDPAHNAPRFANWQLPGAKEGSYRELALVLPSIEARAEPTVKEVSAGRFEVVGADGRTNTFSDWGDAADFAAGQRDLLEALPNRQAADYQTPSGHSMGAAADINRLAHIRFNERTGPNGERVLFIEEIQSDWAQAGKKKGFTNEERSFVPITELPPGIDVTYSAAHREYTIRTPNGVLAKYQARTGVDETELSVYNRYAKEKHDNEQKHHRVPTGPFVGKTEAWVGLSLKRMIRYAAENGFDQIAWTTGEQQAARYNLAQVVHRIDVVGRTDARTGDQSRQVIIHAKDGTAVTLGVDNAGKIDNANPGEYKGKALEDVVGKAMAEKIMASRTQTIEGDGLKIGGEGMHKFYGDGQGRATNDKGEVYKDKDGKDIVPILPMVAKDVLKKLGGGKVEQVDILPADEMSPLEKLQEARSASGMTMNEWMRTSSSEQKARTEEYWRNKPVETMAQSGLTITPEMRDKAMESQALFQKAGHMSPHTFDKFSHAHMGAGEGAQVYGWGTYLFTNESVGKWYHDNFMRKAQQDARIILRDGPFDPKWIDAKGFATPEMRTKFTEPQISAASEFTSFLDAGESIEGALRKAIARVNDIYGADNGKATPTSLDAIQWLRDQVRTNMHEIGAADDPAYKTPTGDVVHTRMGGEAKAKADAIAQVLEYGYQRAATTFDNLTKQLRETAEFNNRKIDESIANVEATIARTDYQAYEEGPSKWGLVETRGTREWTIMSGGDVVSGNQPGNTPEHAIANWKEDQRAAIRTMEQLKKVNLDRVTEMEKTRQLVDEYTEPGELLKKRPAKVSGIDTIEYLRTDGSGRPAAYIEKDSGSRGGYTYYEPQFGNRNFRTLKAAEEFGDARATARNRKPIAGIEKVQPEIKKPRKYTVEAPENDVLLHFDDTMEKQSDVVKAKLEEGGIKILTQAEIDEAARQSYENDVQTIKNSGWSAEELAAQIKALWPIDSSVRREIAFDFLKANEDDPTLLVMGPDQTGRSLYVDLMKDAGYDPTHDGSQLDGPNTQYARAASQTLAAMGIPGHRYFDGSSRRQQSGTHNLVIYDENAIDIRHMEQDQARGFLSIDADRKMTIGLLASADKTTFLHESGHFFLEVMDDLAKTVPALAKDMDVLFTDWGITREHWDRMNLDERRTYHEQFARGFEAYVMTNKPPSEALRDTFRRFRDWLIEVYKSASALNVKVSTEVRAMMDRLLNSELRDPTPPTTDRAAPSEAPGSPPPPRPGAEGQAPPGAVDPFADLMAERAAAPAWEPRTTDDPTIREILRNLVENEAGWAQEGGKWMGQHEQGSGTPNFSTWIPKAEWWMDRPDKKLNAEKMTMAVRKHLRGDKTNPAETRAVEFLTNIANERMRVAAEIGKEEWNNIAQELVEAELEPTTRNVVDADAVAIASQIDEAQVERLALQYSEYDDGFMAEIRRIIDDYENPAAAGSRQEGGEPAPTPTPESARAEATAAEPPDALTREAALFAQEHADIMLTIEAPDGSVTKQTAAEYLASVHADAQRARDDAKLFDVAAQCLLGAT